MNKKAVHIPAKLQIQDPDAWGGLKGKLFVFLQRAYQLVSSFTAHQGTLRAAALTYTTMLSLVPLLAIAFSVLKGLGAQNALEPLLQQVAGDSKETISRIISYVNNTNVKSLGAVGLLLLVLTVISMLEQIEESFNAVWGVQQNRPFQRRFSDYLSVVVVGPILLLSATSMTTSLQSQWLVQWLIEHTYLGDTILLLFRMVPYLFIWLAMTFLYIFIPNTKVRFGSAALGGVLAGTAWQIAQWGYFYFQVGMANYNAIYGTLAALPIFLVWVYTSWVIVLLGLEVVYAHQNRAASAAQLLSGEQTVATREVMALSALLLVCSHFRDDAPPPATAQLSNELGMPLFEAEELMESLRKMHFLARVGDDGSGWLPGRDPSAIMLDEVLTALRGEVPQEEECAAACGTAIELLGRESHVRRESLKGVRIIDIMKKLVLVLLLASTGAQAETYRWSDKEGTVHFSESRGEIPADYRNSAKPLGLDTSTTTDRNRAGSFPQHRQGYNANGAVVPEVQELKERMLKDEGIMALIRILQNDPEMQALLADPAIISAVQAGDIGKLLNNPVFLKLLNNPRVQEIENRMHHGGTR